MVIRTLNFLDDFYGFWGIQDTADHWSCLEQLKDPLSEACRRWFLRNHCNLKFPQMVSSRTIQNLGYPAVSHLQRAGTSLDIR